MAGLIPNICKVCGGFFAAAVKRDVCGSCTPPKSYNLWQYRVAEINGDNITENSPMPKTCQLFVAGRKWYWKDKKIGLENGPFETMGKARKDACLALY